MHTYWFLNLRILFHARIMWGRKYSLGKDANLHSSRIFHLRFLCNGLLRIGWLSHVIPSLVMHSWNDVTIDIWTFRQLYRAGHVYRWTFKSIYAYSMHFKELWITILKILRSDGNNIYDALYLWASYPWSLYCLEYCQLF